MDLHLTDEHIRVAHAGLARLRDAHVRFNAGLLEILEEATLRLGEGRIGLQQMSNPHPQRSILLAPPKPKEANAPYAQPPQERWRAATR